MPNSDSKSKTDRRRFLGSLASGAAAVSLASFTPSLNLHAEEISSPLNTADDPDKWFDQVKGKHRIVFDATHPHEVLPFAWPAVFLMTNSATGSPASDCGVVVVLRHSAICYAFQDKMWEKYNFAEVFEAKDHGSSFQAADAATATKTRNPFWKTKHGDFAVPGIGAVDIGIKDLQTNGVMFCVCNAAMTVYSNVIAGKMGMKSEDVMNDWKANIIPGIQIVPSGVWAVGRAQEHKCAYCFAG